MRGRKKIPPKVLQGQIRYILSGLEYVWGTSNLLSTVTVRDTPAAYFIQVRPEFI